MSEKSCCPPTCCAEPKPAEAALKAKSSSSLPVAILGAGPVGLAAAAECAQRNLPFVVLEQGPAVAHSVQEWGHVQLFSPWRYNLERQARALLESSGWIAPDEEALPTGAELVELYLKPLAAHPAIAPGLRLNARVQSVGRKNIDKLRTAGREEQPFQISLADGTQLEARAVIDATGSWSSPNPLGSSGYSVPGEHEHKDRITYGIPDVLNRQRSRYAGKTNVVVGAGHSAITVVLDLVELQQSEPNTKILWVMRRDNLASIFGGEGADALPARGALGTGARQAIETGAVQPVTPFLLSQIVANGDQLQLQGTLKGEAHSLQADQIIACTGFRPNLQPLKEVRLQLDPILEAAEKLGPLIDPNEHSCGTVPPHGYQELSHPEADFYIVGMKSYGRAPTFLMATGYEQVRSIVAALDGDWEAARKVELDLPATGVCRLDFASTAAASSCCA